MERVLIFWSKTRISVRFWHYFTAIQRALYSAAGTPSAETAAAKTDGFPGSFLSYARGICIIHDRKMQI